MGNFMNANTDQPTRGRNVRSTAIYTRSATVDERSLKLQREECARFAAANRICVSDAHIYSDAPCSGLETIQRRSGLSALLEATKAKSFDMVLVEEICRLARDIRLLEQVFKALHCRGVDLYIVRELEENYPIGTGLNQSAPFMSRW